MIVPADDDVDGVGGFLGVGQKDIAVPFKDLKISSRNGKEWLARTIHALGGEQPGSLPGMWQVLLATMRPQGTGTPFSGRIGT